MPRAAVSCQWTRRSGQCFLPRRTSEENEQLNIAKVA